LCIYLRGTVSISSQQAAITIFKTLTNLNNSKFFFQESKPAGEIDMCFIIHMTVALLNSEMYL